MSKTGKTRGVITSDSKSIVLSAVMIIVSAFLFIAPFYKGVFNGYNISFERAIYVVAVWTSITALLIVFYFYHNLSLKSHKDILIVLVGFLPLTYLISMTNAASSHLAGNEVHIRYVWMIAFIIGICIAAHARGSRLLQYALVGSGYVIVLFGFMNWFGYAVYQDALIQGNRLANVFQYPNAYAAYLVAIFVSSLILIASLKKWYWRLIPSLFLVPIFLSFLLTLSRGALLVLPVIVLVYLIFLPWIKQIWTLINIGLTGSISLLLFSHMTDIRRQLDAAAGSTSIKGWLILIGGSLLAAALIYVIHRFLYEPFAIKYKQQQLFKWTNFILPVAFILIAIASYLLVINNGYIIERLPNEIKVRVEGIGSDNSSVTSRNAFYKDSIKIIQDYPLLGAGGGAWSVLYNSYKSYPYISTQAHNFFMQYLVEAGVVGTIVLLLVIIYSLYIFARYAICSKRDSAWDESRLIYPIVALAILAHSLIDFDMSFVYLSVIVFLTLGASSSMDESELGILQKLKWGINRRLRIGYMVIFTGVAVFSLISGARALMADTNFSNAVESVNQTGNYAEFKEPLDTALKLKPNHPSYALFKIDVLRQLGQVATDNSYLDQAEELLDSLGRREPFNRGLIDLQYQMYLNNGELEAALDLVLQKIEIYPWDINLYEKAIIMQYELGATRNNPEYWKQAQVLLEEINFKIDYIRGLSYNEQYASRSFKLTPSIGLHIGRIHFMEGDYEKSQAILGSVLSDDLDVQINRVTMRWFLASLRIQNKDHENYYNKLIEKDPNEKEEIEKLLKMQKVGDYQ